MKKTLVTLAIAALALTACGEKNFVDLGLPSGTKWATCNLGAAEPTEVGNYYTWGGIEAKEKCYDEDDRFFQEIDDVKGHSKYNEADGLMELEAVDDIATITLGNGWKTPSTADVQELIDNCSFELVEVEDGLNYFKVTGPNGNSIIFPAAGDRFASFEPSMGKVTELWTSNLRDYDCGLGMYISDSGARNQWGAVRYIGRVIRPVYTK